MASCCIPPHDITMFYHQRFLRWSHGKPRWNPHEIPRNAHGPCRHWQYHGDHGRLRASEHWGQVTRAIWKMASSTNPLNTVFWYLLVLHYLRSFTSWPWRESRLGFNRIPQNPSDSRGISRLKPPFFWGELTYDFWDEAPRVLITNVFIRVYTCLYMFIRVYTCLYVLKNGIV